MSDLRVLLWTFLAGTIVGLVLYGGTGCAPKPAPKHPAPIQAPPPGYGKKIV